MLYEITQTVKELSELLSEGDIDEQAYKDTLDNLGAEIAVDDVIKAIRNKEAEIIALKGEINKLSDKKNSAENAVDRMKKLLNDYLSVTEQVKVKTSLFCVSQRTTYSADVYGDVPEQYLIPQPPKIDKAAILKDLKDCKPVTGAQLKSSKSISIR